MRGKRYYAPSWHWQWLPLVVVLALLLLMSMASPALGTGHLQEPTRPPVPGGGGGGVGGGLVGGGEEGAAPLKNSVIKGVVINWGYHPEPGVTLRLGDGGWELIQMTSTDGRYLFGPLGSGLAVLKVDLPPGSPLHPATREVVLQTSGDDGIVANFALYGGTEVPRPPAHLTVTASPTKVRPGDRVTFSLKVQNDLPNGISEVLVTLLLPKDLVPQEVQPSCGTVMIYDNPMSLHIGRLVTVRMGSVLQGGTEKVDIVAILDREAKPGTTLESVATLLYAESVMDQVIARLQVGSGVTIAPTTTPELPLAPSPTPKVAQAVATPTSTPVPRGMLPITGGEMLAPLGLALAVVGLLANRLRSRTRR